MASKEAVQMRPFPPRHALCDPTGAVLAPGTRLGVEGVKHALEVRARVGNRVVPGRIEDHGGSEELCPGEASSAPRKHLVVFGKPPTGVERPAEHMGTVAMEYRLEAEAGGHRVDGGGAGEQRAGADGRGQEAHALSEVAVVEMAVPVSGSRFGVLFDQHRQARILDPRTNQHVAERRGIGTRRGDGGVALRLVHYHHIGRRRQGRFGIRGRELRQVAANEKRRGRPRPVQQRGIVEGVPGQQSFEVRRPLGVEVKAGLVEEKAVGGLAGPARKERAQERVLDSQDRSSCQARHRFAAGRGRGGAPNAYGVVRAGNADAHLPSGECEDAPDPSLCQETGVVDAKTPGTAIPGVRRVLHGVSSRGFAPNWRC